MSQHAETQEYASQADSISMAELLGFLLPSGWCWAVPTQLVSFKKNALSIGPFGSNLKVSDYRDDGVPLIFVRNIRSGQFGDSKTQFVSEEKALELSSHLVQPGDILITKMGDPPGDACLYPANRPVGIITADCIRFQSHPTHTNSRFLVHAINSVIGRRQFELLTRGVAQQKVSLARFKTLILPLPPLNEQHRIVAEIETQLTRLDAAVASLGRTRANLKRYRAAVLKAACEGRLVPTEAELSDWQQLALADLISIPLANGRSVPDAVDGFPVLRLTALQNGIVDLTRRKLGAWDRKQAERFLVERDDFLVARGNGSLSLVGRGGLVEAEPDPVAYPDTLIRVRLDRQRINLRYFRLVWNSTLIRRQIESVARTTAGIYKINQNDLHLIVLPVPPLAEQERIVAEVERRFSVLDEMEQTVAHGLKRADRLRQSILRKAFTGELIPQDPDDEPASVLLDRIRAERAATSSGKPTRKPRKRAVGQLAMMETVDQ